MADQGFETNLCSINEIDPKAVAFVQQKSLAEDTVEGLSRLFSALSDPTRLRILHALSVTNELCVCDLAELLGMSQSAISHQLRVLRNLRLVKYRREGRKAFYSLDDEHIEILLDIASEHVRERV